MKQKMRSRQILIQSLTILVILFLLQCSATRDLTQSKNKAYIKRACSLTAYPKLCYRALAHHSTRINLDPKVMAGMALNTTLYSARMTWRLLRDMAKTRRLRPNEAAAMLDCVEDIEDSVQKLGKYTGESEYMRNQMNDALMWVDNALEDDETCVERLGVEGKEKTELRRRIVRLACLTSNALTLVREAYV